MSFYEHRRAMKANMSWAKMDDLSETYYDHFQAHHFISGYYY